MRIGDRAPALWSIAVLALISGAASAQPARDGTCDRHCLLNFLTEYTEALTDNSIARLAVAPTVRVTSNGSVVTLGKGQVWGAGRRIPYRQAFVDPVTGAAVFYGIVTNVVRSARADADDAPDH